MTHALHACFTSTAQSIEGGSGEVTLHQMASHLSLHLLIVLCLDLSIPNAQCSNLVACQGEIKVKLDRTSVEVAGDQGGDDRLVASLGDVGHVKSELVLLIGLLSMP